MNEILFFLTILLNFCGILIAYKLFGKTGVFIWIGFATVVANIEVTKNIDIFGLPQTLGNVIYGTTFLATDILSEKYGGKVARQGVWVGFFTLITFTLMTQVNLQFIPNENDFASGAMETLFSFMPRICIASLAAYLISNMLDTYIFGYIRKLAPKHLWLRNNVATIFSQLVDSLVFTLIAFAGIYDVRFLIELTMTTWIVKIFIALCDTPFLYAARRIKTNDKIHNPITANKQEEQSANSC